MPRSTRLRRSAAVALALAAAPAAALDVSTNSEHIVTTVTDGVYVLRHKRAAEIGALSGNTTVVVGQRDVLVVDSTLLPSIARADLEQIRRWTDKPVRYLVNTHWHGDHTWGNGVYLDAYPGLAIVAHRETARRMAGYLPRFLERNAHGSEILRRVVETGVDVDGTPLDEAARTALAADLPNAERRDDEYAAMTTVLPSLTFDRELEIDLGARTVRLLHLGRGNTSGDVVVWLPEERVAVAGDLVVYPLPFLIGGFPTEWARTLDALGALAPATVVPGHGAVLAGDDARDHLRRLTDLLQTVSRLVREATFRFGNEPGHLDEVREAVLAHPEVAALRDRFAAGDAALGDALVGSLRGLVASSYREAWGD